MPITSPRALTPFGQHLRGAAMQNRTECTICKSRVTRSPELRAFRVAMYAGCSAGEQQWTGHLARPKERRWFASRYSASTRRLLGTPPLLRRPGNDLRSRAVPLPPGSERLSPFIAYDLGD